METINRIKDLSPGIVKLFALPIYNIEKIVNDTVFIKDTNAYYLFNFASDSILVEYEPIKDDQGDSYQIDISGFLPGESILNTKKLNIIRKYRYLIIYQESDGSFRMTGNYNAGLQMSIKYNSGNRDNQTKGYYVYFSAKLLNHPKPSTPYLKKGNDEIVLQDDGAPAATN